MSWIGVIIFGGLALYNFLQGHNLEGAVFIILAVLSFLQDKVELIEKIIISGFGFEPIEIHIEPYWHLFFQENKLVGDEWKMDDIWDKIKEEKFNVLKDGINFTLLKPNLIYWNDRNVFRSEVDFRFRIEEVDIKDDSCLSRPYVGFRVKWGAEGYEMFLSTPESRKENPSYHLGVNHDEMKIAIIPYTELRMFKFKNVKKEIRDQILNKNGWTRQEPDAEYSFIDTTCRLKHKYFTVYYNYV